MSIGKIYVFYIQTKNTHNHEIMENWAYACKTLFHSCLTLHLAKWFKLNMVKTNQFSE